MSVTVYTDQRQKLALTTEIGRGGEGIVYSLSADACAKIYSKPLSLENRRKLELMIQNPPSDPSYATRKHRSISWPTGLLYNDLSRSRCVGFSMPKIDVKVFRKAIYYLDPSDRAKQFGGGFNWKYLYTAAFNIVSSVAAIHERNYCIGDLNESNILIAPIALITLIDCDSFQVPDPTTGNVYRCPVGKAEYTAPELQGKSYCDVDRTAETDSFALAVLLFQLLMEGTHPYQAKGRFVEDAPSTQAKIVKGYFPYTMRNQNITPPDHAPPFEILHPEIQQLFHRCFVDGHLKPQARPTARDWFNTLRMLANRFRQCQANENHIFLDHVSSCPWCEIVKTKGKDLFPSPVGRQIALDEPSVTLDSLQKRVDYLSNYVAMAFADGVLTIEEEAYLIALGSKLQIPRKEVERAIQAEAKRTKGGIASSASSMSWMPPQIVPSRPRPTPPPPPPPLVSPVLSRPNPPPPVISPALSSQNIPLTPSKSISAGRVILVAAAIFFVLLTGLYVVYTTTRSSGRNLARIIHEEPRGGQELRRLDWLGWQAVVAGQGCQG